MSGYFSGFSLNKITDSIATAAHKTQDTLNNALASANVNLNDPETRLSIKSRTRFVQESLGTVSDISKLPPQYQFLEKKSDSLEKVCRRILLVSKTFEVEGYDYPPNLTESISDWWSVNKDGWFGSRKSENANKKKVSNHDDAFLPRSFAQAISKAAVDCECEFQSLKQDEKAGLKKKSESNETAQDAEAQEEDEEDEEDEDLSNLIKVFDSWSTCYKNIDEGKAEMDSTMIKEFNKKLEKLINKDFKKVHELRKKVEDSRLKFDTMRYEVKSKEAKLKAQKAETSKEVDDKAVSANAPISPDENPTTEDESPISKDLEGDSKKETSGSAADDAAVVKEDSKANQGDEPTIEDLEENKLLEKLEDEFVSNTTTAVEIMEEITDSSDILGLVKLFQNFQLVYFRQCVQEVEANLKVLNSLEN
ncbi:uncharacterized protein SKDI_16G4020 [Saccharomyces kudriavzevii IFO 1802]|uniref:YPR148C-like protein n=2 Tax=Saccharomyces kudriavzevii (strain ATCC MYA-4449 / AS 2.2408 / CBS 8840 / NBRC 1802 / NCYC 2889) TaxID=226230 RepID=J6EKM1_SACK1|nr:uncharacterized protein SKDI_16G4020 [Saccharomyces kudriavzevii IFO 1802]EJT43732.1 YPR148C-like protein [Saccharomyces kudriavzevii IFO 1802]CAI4054096.1 hypothetical protein SKDI_16G4020 [Saccharomyces kudriavzevii IFO 1802]